MKAIGKFFKILGQFKMYLAVFIVLIALLANMAQGKDLILYTFQGQISTILSIFLFNAFSWMIWYSARLTAHYFRTVRNKQAEFIVSDALKKWENILYDSFPRLLGLCILSCLFVGVLLVKRGDNINGLKLFALIVIGNLLLTIFADRWLKRKREKLAGRNPAFTKWSRILIVLRLIQFLIIPVLCGVSVVLFKTVTTDGMPGELLNVILVLVFIQIVVFAISFPVKALMLDAMERIRHNSQDVRISWLYSRLTMESKAQKWMHRFPAVLTAAFDREQNLVFIFHGFMFCLLILFIACCASPGLSINIGGLGILSLGLGIVFGVFSLTALISREKKIPIIIVIIVVSGLLIGNFTKTHQARLLDIQRTAKQIDARSFLKQRIAAIEAVSGNEVPLIFIQSDGGAFRSGAWTHLVLNQLSKSVPGFTDHIVSLSGASGGSVGNATWFIENYLHKEGLSPEVFYRSDCLSYTLSLLLGNDVFRLFFPFIPTTDRAAAVEISMERGSAQMEMPFARLVEESDKNGIAPALFINTTRMGDSRPGVVSTIKIDPVTFGTRINVWDSLPTDKDLRISTAVLLGARFPYISPAGGVPDKNNSLNYYVDGGYFDNSGCGITQELIKLMVEDVLADSTCMRSAKGKNYKIILLHVQNTPFTSLTEKEKKVSTWTNDLFAPLLTLAGSYNQQTDFNDFQLDNYAAHLDSIYPWLSCKREFFNLYPAREVSSISMNWLVSNHVWTKMQQRLQDLETGDLNGNLIEKSSEELRVIN